MMMMILSDATGGKSVDGEHTFVPFPKKVGKCYSVQDILIFC